MATNVEFAVSRIASVNPATGEVLGELDSAGPTEVRAAVARARAAQPEWNSWGVRNRIEVLRRFQQILLARKADIARRITQEAGKPQVEALVTEVLVVLDAARFLIDNAYAILRDEKLPHGNPALKTKSGTILHEPYGVIGIISPWNYPFSIPATETMAALVAGNAVVLKPSELTPLIALELQTLLRDAGVPDDIFQVLPGEGDNRRGAGEESKSISWFSPEALPPAGASRRSPPNVCFPSCSNSAAKIPCWCSKTPTSTSLRAARFGERSSMPGRPACRSNAAMCTKVCIQHFWMLALRRRGSCGSATASIRQPKSAP